ncbi:hypothetical protein [Nostoc sp.]|uniref:hypothetical protein n=1 Tax=Nostoc sp. TaxID=1180 RepID=UPI003FA59C3F
MLFGGDGNDSLIASGYDNYSIGASGNNTLNGGVGDDSLTADYSMALVTIT